MSFSDWVDERIAKVRKDAIDQLTSPETLDRLTDAFGDKVKEFLAEQTTELFGKLGDQTEEIFQALGQQTDEVVDHLGQQTEEIFQALGQQTDEVVDHLGQQTQTIVQQITSAIGGVVDRIVNAIPKFPGIPGFGG
jgi:uncharacterized protein YidB (DUF937 family)